MVNHPSSRFLALDLRTQRYGFAAFDGSFRLLGWGFQRHAQISEMRTQRHLAILQSRFGFARIVVRGPTDDRLQNRQRDLVSAVLEFGSSAKVPITLINAKEIRIYFNGKPKYEIAKLVAERFPEISWKLPPKRKVWQPESERQSIFDAMSVAVYFVDSQCGSTNRGSPES